MGAVARNGQVASFSSRHSFVTLTAPGVSLTAATPSGGYALISSTSMSSGIVSGVAALILSRFPRLTGAQVSQVLAESVTPARTNTPGAGLGTIDAARAVSLAAALSRTSQSAAAAAAPAPSHQPERLSTTVARQPGASSLASSLVRYAVAGLGVLIALLVVLLLVMRSRREKARAAAEAASSRGRPRGLHEHRKPELMSGSPMATAGLGAAGGMSRAQPPQVALGSPPAPPGPAASWTATGGFTGGGLGEMQSSASGPHAPGAPFRPAMTPAPKTARAVRGPADGDPGPPWAPAAEPGRTFGSLPAAANSALLPDPGPGIRVPGDMADLPAVPPDAMLPAPFEFGTSPDPDFPPRPLAREGDDFPGVPARVQLPTRQSLGFAAAPVPLDYAPPQAPDFTVPSRAAGLVLSAGSAGGGSAGAGSAGAAGTGAVPAAPADSRASRTAEPGFIWDLSGTDVFPAAAYPGEPQAPGAVPQDDDPGANAS